MGNSSGERRDKWLRCHQGQRLEPGWRALCARLRNLMVWTSHSVGGGAPGSRSDLRKRAGGGGDWELPVIRNGVRLCLRYGKCVQWVGHALWVKIQKDHRGIDICSRTLFPSCPSQSDRAGELCVVLTLRRAAPVSFSVPNESIRMTAQHSDVNNNQPQSIRGQITCLRALKGFKASSRKWLSKTRSAQCTWEQLEN